MRRAEPLRNLQNAGCALRRLGKIGHGLDLIIIEIAGQIGHELAGEVGERLHGLANIIVVVITAKLAKSGGHLGIIGENHGLRRLRLRGGGRSCRHRGISLFG